MAKILIIGCGAIGTQLAHILSAKGHQVTGLKRNPPTSGNSQVKYVSADISSFSSLDNLDSGFDFVFFIVAPDERTEQAYRYVYELGLNNLLVKFTRETWIFVSSTSVYSQSQGEWVDEESVAQPENIASLLIRQAEQKLMDVNPLNISVRFSGIYGEGREYLLRTAKQGAFVQKDPPYFTNRIHQDDCIGVLVFLLEQRLAGIALKQCYLASDDNPATTWEIMSWLAEQMHCKPPVEKIMAGNAEMNKRCDNTRLKRLGYQFIYPDYKQGYAALVSKYE